MRGTSGVDQADIFKQKDHPPYGPNMAPSSHHLFGCLKKDLSGRDFLGDFELQILRRNQKTIFFKSHYLIL